MTHWHDQPTAGAPDWSLVPLILFLAAGAVLLYFSNQWGG